MKNNITIAGLITTASLFALIGVALADNKMMDDSLHGSMMPSSVMMMHPPRPMVLTVSNSGHGLLRGVVTSVATSSISVASWGGIWTVTMAANTTIVPSNGLSGIAVGDYVGVSGGVSGDSPMINAEYLRDWTAKSNSTMHNDSMMHSPNMTGTSSDSMTHH
ncbi:MAG: hypothetical protein HY220_02575 [Candidatus Sungbacteria bacterium]|uniref:DUF5666 domain-containing protein n=1 Tax=Candidatus Sungiibacteriota bacterium TaxID=2750080 RepID=A0A9D6LTY4_9BACT|nr:hypothetical protein [Candidatus Sungbacteria bacterium]